MSLFELTPELASKVALSGAILGGVLMCFFGYRLFKLALGIAGFAGGAVVAAYVAWRLTAPAGAIEAAKTYPDIINVVLGAANRTTLMVWAGSGGVAGAVLSVLMHRVGVFLLGVWLGAILANTTMVRATTDAYLIVLASLGLIGGILALLLRKTIVVLSTALNGALVLMFAIYALLKNYSLRQTADALRELGTDVYVLLGCAVLLGLVGTYTQFCTIPKEKKQEPTYKKVKKPKEKA